MCQIILKSMHKCASNGPDQLNLISFDHLAFKYDLDHQTRTEFDPHSRRNLLNHKRSSIAHSVSLLSKHRPDMTEILLKGRKIASHLSIQPSTIKQLEQMFEMALLLLKENNCAKVFCNPCMNIEVTARTSSIYRF